VSATGDVNSQGEGVLDIDGPEVHVSLTAEGEVVRDKNMQNVNNPFAPPQQTRATTDIASTSEFSCPAGGQSLLAECTNDDFYVWNGELDKYSPPSYPKNVYGDDGNWSTTSVQHTPGWETGCVAYVQTNPNGRRRMPATATCKTWCEGLPGGWVCNKALDDAHWQTENLSTWLNPGPEDTTGCTLHPPSNLREEIGQSTPRPIDGEGLNGCNATFKTQICGCAKLRPAPTPSPPPTCNWGGKSFAQVKNLDIGALEDCTGVDYYVYKGLAVRGNPPNPTYNINSYGADDKWTTSFDLSDVRYPGACVAYMDKKDRGTGQKYNCNQFCAGAGMTCVGGMDDAHWQREKLNTWQAAQGLTVTNCTVFPGGHDRKDTDNNGCNQVWRTKICACKNL